MDNYSQLARVCNACQQQSTNYDLAFPLRLRAFAVKEFFLSTILNKRVQVE